MHFEVEEKFPIADSNAIEVRLDRIGAKREEPLEQTDLYLKHPARDFALTDEALRIRVTSDSRGQHSVITYKGPKIDPHTKTRREIELPLTDADQPVQSWRELFAALGFDSVAEVKKRRRPWVLQYKNQRVEVALDELAGLGNFVELEISADEHHVYAAKECLTALAKDLGLAESERRSYLELSLGHIGPPSAVA